MFNSSKGTIQCSCAKFEMMGLLCSHCMRVMRQLDIVNISQKYFLPRWSSIARKYLYSGRKILSMRNNSCTSILRSRNMIFRNYICRIIYQISTEAQVNGCRIMYDDICHPQAPLAFLTMMTFAIHAG
ncbi:Putative protein FAR1-RELATED SEQUENCE 10 [Dendrobium catenatum]|uniref:Protein FAR1-RELATED SEQUENCE n=1 Tax=Dendrobium catenatum TaxID=906689 RepID=A0A2I0VFI1_9ASPA|nr:Putative protein FAR1-RELATED SEQUENCE 10 [Dendrobium catenatum]